jgi:hypothetical protein
LLCQIELEARRRIATAGLYRLALRSSGPLRPYLTSALFGNTLR